MYGRIFFEIVCKIFTCFKDPRFMFFLPQDFWFIIIVDMIHGWRLCTSTPRSTGPLFISNSGHLRPLRIPSPRFSTRHFLRVKCLNIFVGDIFICLLFSSYYVAFRGDSQRGRTSFTIGDGVMTTDGSTTFTNPRPETGVDYYVFIRLYSGIDVS